MSLNPPLAASVDHRAKIQKSLTSEYVLNTYHVPKWSFFKNIILTSMSHILRNGPCTCICSTMLAYIILSWVEFHLEPGRGGAEPLN